MKTTTIAKAILPLSAALVLAACGQEEPANYEADVEDLSEGGELQVTPEDPNAVPVDLPGTPMTPVSEEEAEAMMAEEEAAAE